MPVLYGVFLYMGVASLSGIQVRLVPAAAAVYRNKLIFFCVCVCSWTSHLHQQQVGSYSKLPGGKTSSQSVHTDGRENRITQEIKTLGGSLESPK